MFYSLTSVDHHGEESRTTVYLLKFFHFQSIWKFIANITVTFIRDTCKWFSDSMLLFYQVSCVENKIIHQYVGCGIKKKSILLLFKTTFPVSHALKDNI